MTQTSKYRFTALGIFLLAVLAVLFIYPGNLGPLKGFFGKPLKLGLDLQGGAHLVYQADMGQIPSGDRTDAIDSARDVIERRVNLFGVGEPVVQTNVSGDRYRIIVELPGVTDINAAIAQIGKTPLLEFREPDIKRSDSEALARAKEALAQITDKKRSFEDVANEYSEDPSNVEGESKKGGDIGFISRGATVPEFEDAAFALSDSGMTNEPVSTPFGYHLIKRIESRQGVVSVADTNTNAAPTENTEIRVAHVLVRTRPAPTDLALYYSNFKNTGLSGKQLKKALVVFDPNTGQPQVSLTFNDEGRKLFADVTKRNLNDSVAIFLDGQPVSIPTVNQEITSGEAVISGSFTVEEAKQLVRDLNAGALPVPVELINQQHVGATLGEESMQRSLVAGILGIFAVALFMIVIYRLPGLIAIFALLFYALLVLALFVLWPVTLSLSGIAGFILSIGMAVDANVLIFERLKEELRLGRSLDAAVKEGFSRAWLSIRDSNASSLITCAILYGFGTGIVRGFAITLALGIAVSMFTAITVTRTVLILFVKPGRSTWWFGVKT